MMPHHLEKVQNRRARLEEELQRILGELPRLNVKRAILFGSLATGDVRSTSDIDLIVIQDTEERFMKRLDRFYNQLKPNVALDLLVYTPQEFEAMKQSNPFIRTALKQGRVVYEADS